MQKPREPRTSVLVFAVGLIAAIAFVPAIAGGWIYDDRPLIAENPYIQNFGSWTQWLTTDFWHVNQDIIQFGNRMVYWRPAITASYAVDWQLGGGAPAMFHLTNTIAQAVMGGLAFLVLRRWIGATWPALLAALLFAVHPTKAESVAWIAGRTDVFCMIAMLVATIGVGRRLRGEKGGIALEVLGTIAAYTTKEQALVLPAFVAVEVWVAAGRPPLDKALVVQMARKVWPQAVVSVTYVIARAAFLPIRAAGIDATPQSLVDRALTVLESFGWFVHLTVAPYPMSIQQALTRYGADRTPVHSVTHILLGTLLLAAFGWGGWLLRRRFPALGIGLGLFIITLAPTANLIPTQMSTLVSERFLYLPVIGIALVAGAALSKVTAARMRAAYSVAALVTMVFVLIAMDRSRDYIDEREFWNRELILHPGSTQARSYATHVAIDRKEYARALSLLLAMKQGVDESDGLVQPLLIMAYDVAAVTSRLVPDRDTASLRSLDDFARTLLEGTAHTAILDTPQVTFTYPLSMRSFTSTMEKRGIRTKLLALRADVLGRMGDDAGAIAAITEARRRCAMCMSVVPVAALAYARAGRYPEAIEVLDAAARELDESRIAATREHIDRAYAAREQASKSTGPAQLQAQATELAQLELWGRAYAVLAPYTQDITRAPRFALGFAELAYRAGDEATARTVLAANLPADQIAATIETWTMAMGWQR